MVVDVAGISALDVAKGVAEAVPNGFSSTVEVPSAFDLIGSRCGTPEKIFWELDVSYVEALSYG
jgi:hypothetical protein